MATTANGKLAKLAVGIASAAALAALVGRFSTGSLLPQGADATASQGNQTAEEEAGAAGAIAPTEEEDGEWWEWWESDDEDDESWGEDEDEDGDEEDGDESEGLLVRPNSSAPGGAGQGTAAPRTRTKHS